MRFSPAFEDAASLSLQVPAEQLTQWRTDVVAQRQVVLRVKTEYQAVTEQLQHGPIGRGNWGDLVRQQRFLVGEVEEQEAKLRRREHFVALIAQGATIEEACAQVLAAQPEESLVQECAPAEAPLTAVPAAQAAGVPADPAPRLEGQKLRQALFTTLTRLFTTGDARDITLERGKLNKAIQKFELRGLQPEEVIVLKTTYERLWPKIACTVMGVANNLSLLIGEARKSGYMVGFPFEEGQEAGGYSNSSAH